MPSHKLIALALLSAFPALATAANLSVSKLTENADVYPMVECITMSGEMDKAGGPAEIEKFIELYELGKKVSPAVSVSQSQICLSGLKAGTPYKVVIKKGLKDNEGNELAFDASAEFKTSNARPQISLGGGTILTSATGSEPAVKVSVVNLKSVDALIYALPAADALDDIDGPSRYSLGDFIRNKAVLLASASIKTEGPENQAVDASINLREILTPEHAAGEPARAQIEALRKGGYNGTYLVLAKDPAIILDEDFLSGEHWQNSFGNEEQVYASRLLVVSDLGVTTYRGSQGMDVAVRSISNATPVEDATVRLISAAGACLGEAKTDNNGYAHFRKELTSGEMGSRPGAVEASTGRDMFRLSLTNTLQEVIKDNIDPREGREYDALAYTDRPSYRPGQTMHYTALVRGMDLRAAALSKATLLVLGPQRQELHRELLQAKAPGAFELDYTFAPTAVLGSYTLELQSDDDHQIASTRVKVSAIMPEMMTLERDTAKDAAPGQLELILPYTARFNYGAPASDLMYNGFIHIEPCAHPFTAEGLSDFWFGPTREAYSDLAEHLNLDDGKTGGQGDISVTLNLSGANYARKITTSMSVYDPRGEEVNNKSTQVVGPSFPLLGVRQLPTNDGKASFALCSYLIDGTAVAGEYDYTLYHNEVSYQYVLSYNSWNYVRNVMRRPVSTGKVKVDNADLGQALLSMDLPSGEYELEVKGDGPSTTFSFFHGYAISDSSHSPERITVATTKDRYAVGEDAVLTFDCAFDGFADLAVGTDYVTSLTHHKVHKGHNEIKIKTSDALVPGVHALLSVYTPLKEAGRAPLRALGLAYVSLDTTARELTVSAQMPKTLTPGSTVEIPFTVEGQHGENLYYTAELVDHGLLTIGAPIPTVRRFYEHPRDFGIALNDVYHYVIRAREGGQGYGGEDEYGLGAMPATLSTVPARFVSLHQGITELKGNRGTLSFDLPRFTGALDLKVTVFNDVSCGVATASAPIRGEVAASLGLPRFLAPGDKSEATLSLANIDRDDPAIEVTVTCKGALKCAAKPRTEKVAKGKRSDLRIPIEAIGQGEGTVSYALNGPGLEDSDELSLEVRPAWPRELRLQSRMLKANETKQLAVGGSLQKDALATATYGAIPPTDIKAFTRRMQEAEPHSIFDKCAVAQSLMLLDDGKDPKLARRIQDLIDGIVLFADYDGTFRLYLNCYGDSGAATVYAAETLAMAKEKGFDVTSAMIRKVMNAIGEIGSNSSGFESNYASDLQSRLGIYNLATLKYRADEGECKSPAALARLAAALHRQGDGDRARRCLGKAEEMLLEWQGLQERYLSGKVTGDQRKQVLGELILHTGTDLNSLAYDAFTIALAKQECGEGSDLARFAEAVNLRALGASPTLPEMAMMLKVTSAMGDTVQDSLTINDGMVSLSNPFAHETFATAAIYGLPTEQPQTAANGIKVQKTAYTTAGKPLKAPYKAKVNELIVVVAQLDSSNGLNSRVQVDNPIPAGFEVVEVLSPGSDKYKFVGKLSAEERMSKGDDALSYTFGPFSNPSIRYAYVLRAAVPGTYRLPTTAAYLIKQPSWRGVFSDTAAAVTIAP
ncbi:MAG: hypothetical protein K6A65_01685 [Succinivibrionaceae bacterium]|nr:hypothetical protein [Succinivibrionaceae bacterium]